MNNPDDSEEFNDGRDWQRKVDEKKSRDEKRKVWVVMMNDGIEGVASSPDAADLLTERQKKVWAERGAVVGKLHFRTYEFEVQDG